MPHLNVALIGQKFMGRAHSNAWTQVNRFFQPPIPPTMHTVCARDKADLAGFAKKWGWANTTTNWRDLLSNPEIDLVDVTVPNHLHRDLTTALLEAGKHVACEKPLAGSLDEAREMVQAARKYKKSKTFVWYSYRRCPAVAFAHQLAREGRLGRIYHVRAYYLQDWAGPEVPLIWRFQKSVAGSGSHGDLGAHVIDMARFVSGLEFTEIVGSLQETFIKERDLVTEGSKGGIAGGAKGGGKNRKRGPVDVDDATLFIARMTGGAVAHVEATRFATGNQNRNGVEINGDKGSVMFNFEDMNTLYYYDATLDRKVQGWQKIIVTHAPDHPYAFAWWPDAHIIGYEHSFTNMAYDIALAMAGKKPTVPLPDFEDAWKTQRVLHAAVLAADEKRAVSLEEVQ